MKRDQLETAFAHKGINEGLLEQFNSGDVIEIKGTYKAPRGKVRRTGRKPIRGELTTVGIDFVTVVDEKDGIKKTFLEENIQSIRKISKSS